MSGSRSDSKRFGMIRIPASLHLVHTGRMSNTAELFELTRLIVGFGDAARSRDRSSSSRVAQPRKRADGSAWAVERDYRVTRWAPAT